MSDSDGVRDECPAMWTSSRSQRASVPAPSSLYSMPFHSRKRRWGHEAESRWQELLRERSKCSQARVDTDREWQSCRPAKPRLPRTVSIDVEKQREDTIARSPKSLCHRISYVAHGLAGVCPSSALAKPGSGTAGLVRRSYRLARRRRRPRAALDDHDCLARRPRQLGLGQNPRRVGHRRARKLQPGRAARVREHGAARDAAAPSSTRTTARRVVRGRAFQRASRLRSA